MDKLEVNELIELYCKYKNSSEITIYILFGIVLSISIVGNVYFWIKKVKRAVALHV